MLWVNGFGALVNFTANLYCIPKYGFMGAAAVTIISEFVVLIISFIMVQKAFRFSFDFIPLTKTMISGVFAFLGVYLFVHFGGIQNPLLTLFLGGTLMTIFYSTGIYFTGAIPKELWKRFF